MALEAQEVAVRVRLTGGSQFEREASGVAKSVEGIGAAGKKTNLETFAAGVGKSHNAVTKLGSKVDKFGGTMMGLGRAIAPASAALAGLGYYALKAQSQFQSSMMLLYSQAGLPRKNLQGLTKDVLALSKAVGQTPNALAQGAFPIVSSGIYDPKKITSLLKLSGVMAAVGHDTVNNTANALTSILNTGFNPKGGAKQVAAWLEATVGQGKMHLPELTQALNTSILPMAKMAHISLPQILASAAALTRQGVDPSTVFSRMRLSLTSVLSPTTMGAKAMARMHMNPFQLSKDIQSQGIIGMLKDLTLHTVNMSRTERLNLIAQIFGKSRGIGNIGALLDALPSIEKIHDSVLGATPSLLQQHFGGSKSTSAFKWQQIKAELDVQMIGLGQAIQKYLIPDLVKLIPILTSLVKDFGKLSPGVRKAIVLFGGLVIVASPLLMIFGGLFRAVGSIMKVFGWLYGKTVALGGAEEVAAGEAGGAGLLGGLKRLALGVGFAATALYTLKALVPVLKQDAHDVTNLFSAKGRAKDTRSSFLRQGGFGGGTGFTGPSILHPSNRPSFLKAMFGWIPGLASGGMVQSSGLTFVGERGPELLSLPRGATVSPLEGHGLASLKAEFSNGGFGTIVTNLVLDRKILATAVEQVERNKQNRK